MECERIIEKVQAHAFLRIQSVETAHDCRISLPLLEPNGDSITERRVDLSYRTRREPLGDPDNVTDVFVIAADIGAIGPAKAAQDAAIAAHDLSALDDEPITRIVHGVVHEAESANGRAEQARRLIESVASAPRIEQYSWDDNDHKKVFVEKTRDELGRRDRASASLTTTAP